MILNANRNDKINKILQNFLVNKYYTIIFYMKDNLSPIKIRVHRFDILETIFKNVSESTSYFTICDDDNDSNLILSVKELFNNKLEIIL